MSLKGPRDERYKVSRAQEGRAARKLGAKQHAGSGSGSTRHDMHTADALVECKTVLSGKKQITIKSADLASLRYHAAVQDRVPVLFVTVDGQDWVLLPQEYYEESSR